MIKKIISVMAIIPVCVVSGAGLLTTLAGLVLLFLELSGFVLFFGEQNGVLWGLGVMSVGVLTTLGGGMAIAKIWRNIYPMY